jgi:hypothetical protein
MQNKFPKLIEFRYRIELSPQCHKLNAAESDYPRRCTNNNDGIKTGRLTGRRPPALYYVHCKVHYLAIPRLPTTRNDEIKIPKISSLFSPSARSFVRLLFIAFQLAPNFIFTIQYKSYLLPDKS